MQLEVFQSVLLHGPRLVTLDIGRNLRDQTDGGEPLCFAEQLSIIGEIASLGVGETRLRLLFHDPDEIESVVRLTDYARRRHCQVTVVCHTAIDGPLMREICALKPHAIAVPLHSHDAALHDSLAGPGPDWSQSIHLATALRLAGAMVEIESTLTSRNLNHLLPLSEVVESLQAASWRLDYSRANITGELASAAAVAILHIAATGGLQLIVHGLPQLDRALPYATAGLRPAMLPFLESTSSADAMHISWFGDLHAGATLSPVAGSVRQLALVAI
jgi:hypothetical protein